MVSEGRNSRDDGYEGKSRCSTAYLAISWETLSVRYARGHGPDPRRTRIAPGDFNVTVEERYLRVLPTNSTRSARHGVRPESRTRQLPISLPACDARPTASSIQCAAARHCTCRELARLPSRQHHGTLSRGAP